jgi:hypothetical protein
MDPTSIFGELKASSILATGWCSRQGFSRLTLFSNCSEMG